MMNRVVLVGRLTKDPDLRYTPSGVPVATFTLAVNRTFSNQQGEREADFINCVGRKKTAKNVANIIKKGSYVIYNTEAQDLITKAFNEEAHEGMFIKGVVSRKKQILPAIMQELEK